ncbi:probable acyl-CoA dehydrogenase fadE25 [Hyalella azteca]|uniref:Probable acyl-CoA dehydrogenase fadE25 n=1 Tax=Hyalella azteca TaxID=294128 RepID=A0A8B7NCW4_HYAAZ|nr:probable acyl-CoA dehydrogenase fadE25 [Hyalella azteca]
MKSWGSGEYWGVGAEFDPDWMLTPQQRELRDKLVELCRSSIRPKAAAADRHYVYPRESLQALASLDLLALLVPESLGGLGASFVTCAMVVETIARYGCPSTALVYCMHLLATSMLLYRHSDNPTITALLKDINQKKLIGTSVHSDPTTGGHFWYPLSSKSAFVSDNLVRYLKYGSWSTSAGYADFYAVVTASPDSKPDPSNMTTFLCFRDEVRAYAEDWQAMGMHGNMSGEVVIDCELPTSRIVGKPGDGASNNSEAATSAFCVFTSACWNGIAMACLDVAKKHVTRNAHGDVGMRVCDYPAVQDHFGSSLTATTAARLTLFSLCQQLDRVSNNNDWSLETTLKLPRSPYTFWLFQVKATASENASRVAGQMLKACGGNGYKSELGLERLFRDAKAGCVMAPTTEVVNSIVGQVVLLGADVLDLWNQKPNQRVLHQELSKLSLSDKEELLKTLTEDIAGEKSPPATEPYEDFDNPFSTAPARYLGKEFEDGGKFRSALEPKTWTSLKLLSRTDLTPSVTSFRFSLPSGTNHSGLMPGQYVKVRVETPDHGAHERFFSPASPPSDASGIEIVVRYESHGVVSDRFRNMRVGSSIACRGPCGGFEYTPNSLAEVTLLASGGGITPGLQLIRTVLSCDADTTKLALVYYAATRDEILYRSELESYASTKKNFRLVLSLGEASEGWTGEEGFIDQRKLDRHVPKNTSRTHKILVCGGPQMSISCCHGLRLLGFRSTQIFVFGQFGDELIRKVYGRNALLSTHTCY